MKINANLKINKFPVPVLGDNANELYGELYGENGENFVRILDDSPDEIAVISILITYLKKRIGAE